MKIKFDLDSLRKREKTILYAEDGKTLYWSIYDFSFKHRTRIFNINDEEIAYVELDVSKDNKTIKICDNQDNLIDTIENNVLQSNKWFIEGDYQNGKVQDVVEINNGVLDVYDDNNIEKCLYILFSLVEKER